MYMRYPLSTLLQWEICHSLCLSLVTLQVFANNFFFNLFEKALKMKKVKKRMSSQISHLRPLYSLLLQYLKLKLTHLVSFLRPLYSILLQYLKLKLTFRITQ